MEYVTIVMTIIEMIQKCRENRDRQQITGDALNRRLGRIMIRRALRKKGLRGRDLNAAMQVVRDEEMDDIDVKEFVSEALSE